jgi:hypothetical protein
MIFNANPGMGPEGLKAAFSRLVDELNRFHPTANRWPTFADDAAAAAGNLKVGEPYATPEGALRRRVS